MGLSNVVVFGNVRFARGLGYIRMDSTRCWVMSDSPAVLGKVWFLEASGNVGSTGGAAEYYLPCGVEQCQILWRCWRI